MRTTPQLRGKKVCFILEKAEAETVIRMCSKGCWTLSCGTKISAYNAIAWAVQEFLLSWSQIRTCFYLLPPPNTHSACYAIPFKAISPLDWTKIPLPSTTVIIIKRSQDVMTIVKLVFDASQLQFWNMTAIPSEWLNSVDVCCKG